MMSLVALGTAATGTALLSRFQCNLARVSGAVLVGAAVILAADQAWADQTVMAADSSQVDCTVSARDLTRISLVEDEFAAVSKISTGDPAEDFSVVNEPVRGDIYLSVPEGFARPALSFFGTSKRGYVYKFVCRVDGDHAVQVFVSNPAIAKERPNEDRLAASRGPQDAAIELIQAMYANAIVTGFEMRQRSLTPVHVGPLKVQLIAEYQGSELSGKVLRIENKAGRAIELTETMVAPASALAVSVAETRLPPGQVTTAYVVSHTGG